MGMTDRQFDSYLSKLLKLLMQALEVTPENKLLKEVVEELEADLKRP
jgi:hypothetical protein